MLLRVVHRTTFVYSGPVRDSFNEVRLRPVDDDRQRCNRFDLRVTPLRAEPRDYEDYYGNRVYYFDVPESHEELVIETDSEVQTLANLDRPSIPLIPTGPNAKPPALELHAEYLAESHYVPLAFELWREVQDVFAATPRSDLWSDAVALGNHVYKTFAYRPNTTGVNTIATDALKQRMGVCQDFAHVMLGLCRQAGIAARYVSGYFFNDLRRPDEIEASHAWVEVLIPEFGWVGYDPTHARIADERYVKIAAGRDYSDIRPISGTYRGAPTRDLRVEVSVREITPATN